MSGGGPARIVDAEAVRVKTDSLWPPIVMHALHNLIATIGVALYVKGP